MSENIQAQKAPVRMITNTTRSQGKEANVGQTAQDEM